MDAINQSFLAGPYAITKIPITVEDCHKHTYIYKLLGSRQSTGIFCDVGAHSSGHHTTFFEKLGWRGLCFEPIPELFKQLQSLRTCECLQVCLYDKQTTPSAVFARHTINGTLTACFQKIIIIATIKSSRYKHRHWNQYSTNATGRK